MHPITSRRGGFALFLLIWVPIVSTATVLALGPGSESWQRVLRFTIPLGFAHALLALAAWYPCRAVSLRNSSWPRLLATHLIGTALAATLWVGFAQLLSGVSSSDEIVAGVERSGRPLLAIGGLLYVMAVAIHYLLVTVEESREAEQRSLEARYLARDSELRALRAQIDPHFLFNSLNSVASLCGTEPAQARAMTIAIAEFLRATLRFGARESVSLTEEVALARQYLEIERIRFGARLRVTSDVDPGVAGTRVPPLLLQPLVENAIQHGVEHLVGPGEVRIQARRTEQHCEVTIANAADDERPASRGEGIGLANVRSRLEALFGTRASVTTDERDGWFTATLLLPVEGAGAR